MSDRVTAEELANTAPDPSVDFEGFINVTTDHIVAELDGLAETMSRKQFRELLILRATARLERAILNELPPAVVERFARNVIRTIGRWSELNESPDGREEAPNADNN